MLTTAGKGIFDSHYARRKQELNNLITELRALGAQESVCGEMVFGCSHRSHYNRHTDSCSKIKWNMHKMPHGVSIDVIISIRPLEMPSITSPGIQH
ncbi:hypothetical protein FRC03_004292 [Tulasnella sp. 419]|nr:hypothetical protein FRC03_004292 [Tulasnella sp. 419]